MNDIVPTRFSTSLDITQEKKDLEKLVTKKEREYKRVLEELDALKFEISEFQELYDSKIGRLYVRLQELENLIFKYEHISEYVDDIFSFSDAEKLFEGAMKEHWERLTDEFNKRNRVGKSSKKRNGKSTRYQEELKQLYRNLARIFHPDKTEGNSEMMIRINQAYKEGDLEGLRSLNLEHGPKKEGTTITELYERLSTVTQLITDTNKVRKSLEKSDMYIEKQKAIKNGKENTEVALDVIAQELILQIARKEKEVVGFVDKFGIGERK